MDIIDNHIIFSEDEQRWADLPGEMPLAAGRAMADHLIDTAPIIQVAEEAEAKELLAAEASELGYVSVEEMLAEREWQVISRRANWRYSVGRELHEKLFAHDVEAFVERGSDR